MRRAGAGPPATGPGAPAGWDHHGPLEVVGRPHTRVEGLSKVTGQATYACDVRLPGLLHAAVLRSPLPHARIGRIDSSRAEALPGVHAVMHLANAPEVPWYGSGLLFDGTLRFVGDEVAAVAADTEEVAEDALRLIEVEYEALPFVATLGEALRPGAPAVHESGNVAGGPDVYERGDVEAGLREADVVVEQVYTTQTALHNCMEPHGCTAAWEAERLTLWESTQAVFDVRSGVAEALGLDESRVRVITEHMGGGFGAKQIAWKHAAIAALLSQRTGRPVQLVLDREAENLAVGNRNATRQHVRLGARRDGTLTAIEVRSALGVGAWQVGGEDADVGAMYQRLYRCPNVRTEQVAVHTHAGPAVAFRAPGHAEAAFALESAMDELARALEMDPLDLRLHNYADHDQKRGRPYTAPDGLRLCYERAAEAFGWREYGRGAAQGAKRRGVGLAAHDWGGGGWPPAYAWVELNGDGTARVVTGTQDIGTGTRTALTQVAAEELGLPVERVSLGLGDTDAGPYAPVSAGSATLASMGPAVKDAAADAKARLMEVASGLLDVPAAALRLDRGRVHVSGGTLPGGAAPPSLSIAEVLERSGARTVQGRGERGPNPRDRSVRTFGVQMVEVEVDTETGEVTVLRVVASHDCGRVVNPLLADGQVLGGVTQGLGFALTEERVVDRASGVVLNADLEGYKVPTAADAAPVEHVPPGVPDLLANPIGAKGIGEPPIIPTAAAVASAVFDAVRVRIRELPLSRRRLLEALGYAGADDRHARRGGEAG